MQRHENGPRAGHGRPVGGACTASCPDPTTPGAPAAWTATWHGLDGAHATFAHPSRRACLAAAAWYAAWRAARALPEAEAACVDRLVRHGHHAAAIRACQRLLRSRWDAEWLSLRAPARAGPATPG